MMLSNFDQSTMIILQRSIVRQGCQQRQQLGYLKSYSSPPKNRPEKILIIANKLDTASEFANKVRGFLNQWPDWINVGFS